MKNNIKLIAFDLDGTLLNEKSKITSFTQETLKKIVNKNIKIAIATGRHFLDVKNIKENLGLDFYLITSNGARVHNQKYQQIHANDIENNLLNDIVKLNLDEKYDSRINLYYQDSWQVGSVNKIFQEHAKKISINYKVFDKNNLQKDSVKKIFYVGNYHKLLKMQEELKDHFVNQIELTFSSLDCLEIMAKGTSKANGLDIILKLENFGFENTMAFGDGLNDYQMLKSVQKALIMDNADPLLKKNLDQVEVIKSNKEDGVAQYLKKYFLFK